VDIFFSPAPDASSGAFFIEGTTRRFQQFKSMSKAERTGWRDLSYSAWHRGIGDSLYTTDIDSMITSSGIIDSQVWNEYDSNHECRAIIETKAEFASIKLNLSSHLGNCSLANKAGVPFLIVRYAADLSWFDVCFFNEIAREKARSWATDKTIIDRQRFIRFTEKQYINLLTKLREP
jgi:hypothetical protein